MLCLYHTYIQNKKIVCILCLLQSLKVSDHQENIFALSKVEVNRIKLDVSIVTINI